MAQHLAALERFHSRRCSVSDLGDKFGDGREDLVRITTEGAGWVALSSGVGFGGLAPLSASLPGSPGAVVDIGADGLCDAATYSDTSGV